jgi:hypothetical protein
MNISKRVRVLAAIVGSGIVVASSACTVDVPTSAPGSLAPTAAPSFARGPSGATATGAATLPTLPTTPTVPNGVYGITFDPATDNVLTIGPNRLVLPANSVCNLTSSGYGEAFWNQSCAPETKPVTLTITVSGSGGAQASIDFQPALRFNPLTNVTISFFVPEVSRTDAKEWLILYCPSATVSSTTVNGSGGSGGGKGGSKCVNESLTDKDLKTFVDYDASVLLRRIKHFSAYRVDSGYVVAE